MAWLTSLLKKTEVEEPIVATPVEQVPEYAPTPTGPQLAVLVPDMAGISSFRIRMAPTVTVAEEHVASLRAEVRHDTHAFWAMHDRPIVDDSSHVEALVLIRAQMESDLVYVVSFLDLESALSFTRFEVRRGLYLGNVMIYWAAFAQVREELEGVSITPAFAPPTQHYAPPADTTTTQAPPAEVQPVASTAVAPPQPEVITSPPVETPVEAEAREAVERYLRKHESRQQHPQPVVQDSAAVAEPPAPKAPEPTIIANIPEEILKQPFEERSISLAPEFAEPEVEARVVLEAEPVIELAPEPAIEPVISEVAEEQAAIDEAMVFQHHAVEFVPMKRRNELEAMGEASGMLVDHEPEHVRVAGPLAAFGGDDEVVDSLTAGLAIAEPEPLVETIPGDEEQAVDQLVVAAADPTAGLPQTKKMDDFDIAFEVERLLRHRRWEQKDSPFNGFKSPPGRF
jgi:hypothetical protein